MQHSKPAEAKASLRKTIARQRLAFDQTAEVVSGLDEQLESLVNQVQPKVIAGYLPFANEPNVEPFLSRWIQLGNQVIMPVSLRDGSLTWVNWRGERKPSEIFGFDEASGESTAFEKADLALVPALAADERGSRLGKGKGFYDRALANFRGKTVAVIFDHELQSELPTETHDQTVHFVVTEKRLLASG
jgi:5-formyltetrahydrofolate cyclo-ligase